MWLWWRYPCETRMRHCVLHGGARARGRRRRPRRSRLPVGRGPPARVGDGSRADRAGRWRATRRRHRYPPRGRRCDRRSRRAAHSGWRSGSCSSGPARRRCSPSAIPMEPPLLRRAGPSAEALSHEVDASRSCRGARSSGRRPSPGTRGLGVAEGDDVAVAGRDPVAAAVGGHEHPRRARRSSCTRRCRRRPWRRRSGRCARPSSSSSSRGRGGALHRRRPAT